MFDLFELMLELMAKPGAELRPKFIGFFCHITADIGQRVILLPTSDSVSRPSLAR
jgi:hypothetical protein